MYICGLTSKTKFLRNVIESSTSNGICGEVCARKRLNYVPYQFQRFLWLSGYFRLRAGPIVMAKNQAIFQGTQVSPPEFDDLEQNYGRSITAYTFTNNTNPATIVPAISHVTHLSLAIVFTTLFALLFLMIIVQLFLILYFGHRRLSYQSVFLFIYLIWAALRTTLFSFYFGSSAEADSLPAFPRWLLFALPIYLQFLTLSVLTVYLAKVGRVASCFHPDLKLKFKSVRVQLGLIHFSPSSYQLIQFS